METGKVDEVIASLDLEKCRDKPGNFGSCIKQVLNKELPRGVQLKGFIPALNVTYCQEKPDIGKCVTDELTRLFPHFSGGASLEEALVSALADAPRKRSPAILFRTTDPLTRRIIQMVESDIFLNRNDLLRLALYDELRKYDPEQVAQLEPVYKDVHDVEKEPGRKTTHRVTVPWKINNQVTMIAERLHPKGKSGFMVEAVTNFLDEYEPFFAKYGE